ncbi:hypothetical protein COLAER_01479, partial [Collinsella aerofaciens ATCC 25986]
MPEAVIGLDVGKLSHWACVATRDGEILLSAPVANREGDLDSLFGRFPDALVVVDQSRNIGALALARAKAAGMSAAYLPGLAAHGAARLFAGDAKTDERDAMVIAKTALGIPDALPAGRGSGPDGRGGEGAGRPEKLPDLRKHQEQEPAAQHPAGIVPRLRGVGRPVRRSPAEAHGIPRRGLVGGRRRVPQGGGAHARGGARKIEAFVRSTAPSQDGTRRPSPS